MKKDEKAKIIAYAKKLNKLLESGSHEVKYYNHLLSDISIESDCISLWVEDFSVGTWFFREDHYQSVMTEINHIVIHKVTRKPVYLAP